MLDLIENELKNFDSVHTELLEVNNYSRFNNFLSIFDKRNTCEMLTDYEVLLGDILFDITGKVTVQIEEDLSTNLSNTDIGSLSVKDFNNMPFNFFKISTSMIDNVEKIFVSKKDGKVYFHFQGVGKNKLTVQFILSNKGLFAQYTYSSLYYHREILPINSEFKSISQNILNYTISVVFYLINYQKDNNKVIKNESYENYLKKLTPKHLSKPKVQKKLKNKSNTVVLKFEKKVSNESVSHKNSNKSQISTKFLVRGHWRNQRIGKRDNYETIKIWIKPFFKCVNNNDFKNKIYKIS